MTHATEPSETRRQLGRSRRYMRTDVPQRLFQWHAPRANRWEHLQVEAGVLVIEALAADGVTREHLGRADTRWIAPGARWRIAHMAEDASFHLEIHADEATEPSAPQARRAQLLDAAACVQVDDEAAFLRLVLGLSPGDRCLVRGRFDFGALFGQAMAESGGTLCWHPLEARDGHLTALVARSAQTIDLLEYLGRDHAVIEATLVGALRGEVERLTWLRNVLARHLVIEEDLLFPAYLDAGGPPGWVNGLRKEHGFLKQQLEQLADPASQRRFMLLLEAHDEKEEQIVYPDIFARLGAGAADLQRRAIALGAVRADPAFDH